MTLFGHSGPQGPPPEKTFLSQKFRKGVGGQRGLARRNTTRTRDLGLFSVPLGHISGEFFGLSFWGFVCRQPPPANPFFSKPPIDTFWAFRGSGVWRLLYIGIVWETDFYSARVLGGIVLVL